MIKMLVAVNDEIVVAQMRQKFTIDLFSAAALTRHPPWRHPSLSGDAATKTCSLASSVLCWVGENRQSKFKVTIRLLTIRDYK